MGMGLEGYEAYSDAATHIYLIVTGDGRMYADRKLVLAGTEETGGLYGKAMLYIAIVNRALLLARSDAPDLPEFTAEDRLEAALMLCRMDKAAAEEQLRDYGTYGI